MDGTKTNAQQPHKQKCHSLQGRPLQGHWTIRYSQIVKLLKAVGEYQKSIIAFNNTYVGIIGGGRPPARPGAGGGPRPPGAAGAALGGCGGCRDTGGGLRLGPPPGDGGAWDMPPPPPPFPLLPPPPPPPPLDEEEVCELGAGIQFFTGGGAGVLTVAMDTSPMIFRASLQAWYCRSISSRFRASSALSSIMEC